MVEDILKTAKAIGGCGAEDEALLAALCTASEKQLRASLRRGVTEEACREAFVCAAAWLAAAALCEAHCGGAEELSALRAGDVRVEVKGGGSGERAASLRRSAAALMRPYTEGGFYFCTVKG